MTSNIGAPILLEASPRGVIREAARAQVMAELRNHSGPSC